MGINPRISIKLKTFLGVSIGAGNEEKTEKKNLVALSPYLKEKS
jgi:hypothetical protein